MKNKVLFVFLMGCLPLFLNGQSAEKWFNKGLKAIDFEEKIRCYNQAIQLHYKPLAAAYYNRGNAKADLGKYSEAIVDYTKAIQLDPKDKGAYNNRGLAKEKLGKYSEAIVDYTKAIQVDLNYTKAYYNRGLLRSSTGKFDKAIEDFDKAIKLGHKPLSDAYYYRGDAKYFMDKHSEAVSDYDKAIQLNPNEVFYYYDRGTLKNELGIYAEAIEDFDKAVELDSENKHIYISRGDAKLNLRKYSEAIADYNKAIKLGSNSSSVYYNRGIAKDNLDKLHEAIADYDKAIQLDPENEYIYNDRGLANWNLERYKEAIIDYTMVIELSPEWDYPYESRAEVYCEMDKYEEAIKDFTKAIELKPNNKLFYDSRAEAYYKSGNLKKSLDDFNKVVALDSDYKYVYNERGKVHFDMGNYAQAIKDYDKAIAIGGSSYKPYYKYREDAVKKLNASKTDNTPPIITITHPNVDTRGLSVIEIESNQTTIKGKAEDASGIKSVFINRSSVSVSTDGYFSATTNLSEGNNSFTVQATDTKGNTAKKTFTLRKKAPVPVVVNPIPQNNKNEKRLALVVGNSNYSGVSSLKNKPLNDAEDMSNKLRNLDFEVIVLKDADKERLEKGIANFAQKLRNYDVGLFFYAGHGLGVEGKNYLVPIDFPSNATKSDFRYKCIETDWLQDKMAEAGDYNKTNIVIVDACRDDGGLRNIRGGLGTSDTWIPPAKIPTGLITCYAASQGETAYNGNGRNGLYTSILLKHIATRGIKIEDVFKRVRIELLQVGGQTPEEQTKLNKDFYFVR